MQRAGTVGQMQKEEILSRTLTVSFIGQSGISYHAQKDSMKRTALFIEMLQKLCFCLRCMTKKVN